MNRKTTIAASEAKAKFSALLDRVRRGESFSITLHGEVAARRQMRQINRLFKGGLPGTMGPRTHQRIIT